MKNIKLEHLGVLGFVAIITKASILSINLAESLIVASILATLVGLKYLEYKKEKDLKIGDKLQNSIEVLDERLKSIESRNNMEQFAKIQRR